MIPLEFDMTNCVAGGLRSRCPGILSCRTCCQWCDRWQYIKERYLLTCVVAQVAQLTELGSKIFSTPLIDTVSFVDNDSGDTASEFGIHPKVLKARRETISGDRCCLCSFLDVGHVSGVFVDHNRIDSLLLCLYDLQNLCQ